MARPKKTGLDYFPMDVDADTDEKIEYVVMKHGFVAFGIYVRLLMGIYKNGYYMEFGERRSFIFAKKTGIEPDALDAIINEFVEVGLFDRGIYESAGVLTSRGVQTRFLAATERRKNDTPIHEYALVSVDNNTANFDNNPGSDELLHTETPHKSDNNPTEPDYCQHKPCNNPQSKVKESKVNIKAAAARARAGAHTRSIEENAMSEIVDAFQDNIHPITNLETSDRLTALVDEYGGRWVREAIREAALSRGKTLKYLEAILSRWGKTGMTEPWREEKQIGRSGKPRDACGGFEPDPGRYADFDEADRNQVYPWDVQPDAGGDGAEPGRASPHRGGAG